MSWEAIKARLRFHDEYGRMYTMTRKLGPINPCIYKIVCNNSFYIGSTVRPSGYRSRKSRHWARLSAGTHGNIRLQRCWNKYGKTSFSFEVIEECSETEMLSIEQRYIDKHIDDPSCMNLNPVASKPPSWKGKTHSEATKAKMRKSQLGKKMSDESRKKMRKAKLGLKYSETHKKNMRRSSPYKKCVLQLKNDKIIQTWACAADAQRVLGIHHIGEVCNGKRKTVGGFVWRWA